jgi:hypothetical protein
MIQAGKVTGTFLSSDNTAADLTTYTFAGRTLGAAASNRLIVLGVDASANTIGATAVTIGGVSATQLVAAAGGGTTFISLWVAAVPAGTTGDIVVTFGDGKNRCGIAWWRLVDANATAFHTASDNGATTLSADLNVVRGGFAVGVACENLASGQPASPIYTWTGLNENAGSDQSVESTHRHSAASDSFDAAETGRTITATVPNASTSNCMVLASFRPR